MDFSQKQYVHFGEKVTHYRTPTVCRLWLVNSAVIPECVTLTTKYTISYYRGTITNISHLYAPGKYCCHKYSLNFPSHI